MSFAKVVISGTLTSDPEKRFTPNNHAVTSFNLLVDNPVTSSKAGAVNEPFTVKVTCWRNLAEAVALQLHKGDDVLVEGKLILNSFQAQDGVQKKVFEIDANSIDKLAGRPEPIVAVGGTGEGQQPAPQQQTGGGYDASSRSAAPAYEASYAPPQATAPVAGSAGHFSSEDLLTEDDIPF